MSLIYMQETIDLIITNHIDKMAEINLLGDPELIELLDKNGEVKSKYFKFNEQK